MLELTGWIGPRSIDLPSAWARPHEDVVVGFDHHSPTRGKKMHGARYTSGTEFYLATGDIYATQQPSVMRT